MSMYVLDLSSYEGTGGHDLHRTMRYRFVSLFRRREGAVSSSAFSPEKSLMTVSEKEGKRERQTRVDLTTQRNESTLTAETTVGNRYECQ